MRRTDCPRARGIHQALVIAREIGWRLAEVFLAVLLYQACAWGALGAPARSSMHGAPLLFLPDAGAFVTRAQGFTARFERGGVRIGDSMRVCWPGAREDLFPEAAEPFAVHAFTGRDAGRWKHAEGANRVRYPSLYPGVDLYYGGRGGQLKSEFVVAPGADPRSIRIRYEGALSVRLDASGGLRIEARDGVWTEAPPFLYQEVGGEYRQVDGSYELVADGGVRFRVGPYDSSRPLVIDPALRYSGIFGGTGISAATAVAAAAGGFVYLAGYTDAYDYPTASPLLPRGGGVDGFLMKIETATGRIAGSTFIGGSGDDRIFGLCLDPSGGLYLAGWTTSPNFPLVSAAQGVLKGGRDAFVMKIESGGTALAFSTYFGGSGTEASYAAACNAAGVWIGGETTSPDMTVLQAWQGSHQGQTDGFLARFSSAGSLLSATYAGGSGDDAVRALAVDAAGALFAAGSTTSPGMGFPSGSFQRTSRGGQDGFVLKLNAEGSVLLGGGFLGGTRGGADGVESVNAIVAGSSGVFVGGQTVSPDFTLVNPWRSSFQGASEAFLARLSPALDALLWSTFSGGAADESIQAIALDASGGLIAAGWTTSPDAGAILPVQMGHSGGTDGFVLRTGSGESPRVFQSYLGGTGNDSIMAVTIDSGERIVAAGQTSSPNFPVTGDTVVPPGSLTRAFVTEIASGAAAEPLRLSPSSGSGLSAQFTLTLTHPSGFGEIGGGSLLIHGAVRFTGGCRVRYFRASGQMQLASDDGSTWISVAPGSSAQATNSSCTLKGTGSSVSQSGLFLNVTFALEFAPSFGGVYGLYGSAWGSSGETGGYRLLGSWTVPGAASRTPAPHSVSTSAPNESVQVLTIQIKDSDGGANLESALVLIHGSFTASQGCFLWIDRAANRLYLADDAALNWVGVVFGSSGAVQNSQCLVRAAVSTSETFGETWMIRLEATFKPSFQGTKKVWVQARDLEGNLSAWSELGQIQVAAPVRQAPSITSVLPSSGRGSEQSFQIIASDPNGAGDLVSVLFLVHETPSSSGGCLVLYDRPGGRFLLADDRGVNWTTVRPGTTDVARNSQCILRGSSSSWSVSGLTGTAVLSLQFDPAFIGRKRLWAQAGDSSNLSSALRDFGGYEVISGTQLMSSTQAPAQAAPPPAAPLWPVSAKGTRQSFELTFPNGGTNPNGSRASILFTNEMRSGRACQVVADPLTGRFYLADEKLQFWRQLDLGSKAIVGNSYCALQGANSSWRFENGAWRITLDIEFYPPLEGRNLIWLQATDGRSSHFGPAVAGSFTVDPN